MLLKKLLFKFVYNTPFNAIGQWVDRVKRRKQRSDYITTDERDPYFLMRNEIEENIQLYTSLADKENVKKMLGDIAQTPKTFVVYDGKTIDKVKDIPVNSKVVIKSNNGAGFVAIINSSQVTDKMIKKYYSKFYSSKFYGSMNDEKQYKGIDYKIIIEEYIGDNLLDYKIHYFQNGYTSYSIFSEHDSSYRKISDDNFKISQSIDSDNKINAQLTVAEIKVLREMKKICEKISQKYNIKYARYDFYYMNKKIYLGEITFSHGGGNLFKKIDEHKKEDIYKFISNF